MERAAFRLQNTAAWVRAWWRGNAAHAYWYIGAPNFGDRLTPLLLEHYGFSPVHAPAARSRAVIVGSVLGRVPSDYDGVILGAGLLDDTRRPFPRAQVLGVRGELTRERIDAPPGTLLGDPGLLAPRLVERAPAKRWTLGLVPHYVDRDDRRIREIARRGRSEVTVIDVSAPPRRVLRHIDRCAHILSSSLHGVVVADGLGIPSAWLALSDRVVGARFKFQDYASALGCALDPRPLDGREPLADLIAMTTPPAQTVAMRQRLLDEGFGRLKTLWSG